MVRTAIIPRAPPADVWAFVRGLFGRLAAAQKLTVLIPGSRDSSAYKDSVYRTEKFPAGRVTPTSLVRLRRQTPTSLLNLANLTPDTRTPRATPTTPTSSWRSMPIHRCVRVSTPPG